MTNRVGAFSKVSFDQFFKDLAKQIKTFTKNELDIDEPIDLDLFQEVMTTYGEIKMPRRATAGSAGYDIFTPIGFRLAPGETITIPTGLRVHIDDGWCLVILPRSGLGFKYRLQLDNTIGLIDSDYEGSDNEGHIFVKITNDTLEDKDLYLEGGSAFAQAVFVPYGITYSDEATAVRNGGMGSTG